MSVSNRRKVPLEGADYYPTPFWGTRLLLEHEQFRGSILEPCCGNGAMAKVIEEYYPGHVIASDLYDRGYGTTGTDVFDITSPVGNFITNPPFNIAADVLEHAFKITEHKICLLLRLSFAEGKGRYERFYRANPPSRVWVFSERLSMYPEGYPVKGGGTTSYAWFIWHPNRNANMTEMRWFPTGNKPKGM